MTFMLKPDVLHLGEGLLINASFALAKALASAKAASPWRTRGFLNSLSLALPRQTSASRHAFISCSFCPLLCLLYFPFLQNISKWGIRVIFKNIGVNLALGLHKYMKNHTTNANKIHTYHSPAWNSTSLCFLSAISSMQF